jgi:hypothetical protein
MTKLVAMTFEEASRWLASQEDRIALLEADLARCRAANVYDGEAHRKVAQLEAALRDGAEFLHAFTPAGTPAVDAFIAKWRDFTSETPVRQVHSKSEHKRLTALGVECVVTPKETEPSGMDIAQQEADEAAGDNDPRDRVWGSSKETKGDEVLAQCGIANNPLCVEYPKCPCGRVVSSLTENRGGKP